MVLSMYIPGAHNDGVPVIHGEGKDIDTAETAANEPSPDRNPEKPLPIIIRATNGKSKQKRDNKIKLSTVVEPEALEGFFVKYAEVCKLGMSGLKKRDRSKAKEKLKAKKKKQGGAGILGEIKKK
jgi:signal recognition particle subunit SRP14